MPDGDVKWVGLDVAKDSIAVVVLDDSEIGEPRMDRAAHGDVVVRRSSLGWDRRCGRGSVVQTHATTVAL
jgi:hypothetical protein